MDFLIGLANPVTVGMLIMTEMLPGNNSAQEEVGIRAARAIETIHCSPTLLLCS